VINNLAGVRIFKIDADLHLMAPIANFTVERGCQSAIPVICGSENQLSCTEALFWASAKSLGLGSCSRQFQRPFRVNAARTLPGINSGAIHLLNAGYITQDKLLRDPLVSSKSAYPRLLSRRLAKEEPTAHAGLSQCRQQRR
jgi:hypothetical protein